MPREASEISDEELRVGCAVGLGIGLGPVAWGHARAAGFEAVSLCRAGESELLSIEGMTEARVRDARRALSAIDPAGERGLMKAHGIRAVLLGDRDYPERLAHTRDPPPMLWVRGQWEEFDWDAWFVAVVGSRSASPYGLATAHSFATALGGGGCAVVSGGARGIDAAAHRAALNVNARTVGVLGCGLTVCYPPEHGELFVAMVESGGVLVSELPCDTPPAGHHFPRRNRILAALADAVVVVEARPRSGAMITARLSCELGREVGFVPGRVTDPGSSGCHLALREGWGALYRDANDVIEALRGNLWRVPPAHACQREVDCVVSSTEPP